MRLRKYIATAVLFVGVIARAAVASELCATVTDPADLPLPKAWVNVTNLQAEKSYNLHTDSQGNACLSVPEGLYSVEVGLTGFLNVRYYPVRVIYPNSVTLPFHLLIGDVTEGGVAQEAMLSGTLQIKGHPAEGARICILQMDGGGIVTCGSTNVFGEYALAVSPGKYKTQIRTAQGEEYISTIEVLHPGEYRNRLAIHAGDEQPTAHE